MEFTALIRSRGTSVASKILLPCSYRALLANVERCLVLHMMHVMHAEVMLLEFACSPE